MNGAAFLVLLIAGSAGIILSFALARSRAVFAQDGFTHPGRRGLAMGLLAGVLLLTVAIPFAGGLAGAQAETKDLSVASIFVVHIILAAFLVSYYLLSGRRSIVDFLRLRSQRPLPDLGAGLLVGSLGWLLTLAALAGFVGLWLALRGERTLPSSAEASPLIAWLVSQSIGIRIGIVLSAMTIEELFFRSFLQTRVGAVASTLMFTAAHGAYGEPLGLVGILMISAVLSIAFTMFGNVLPCIIAHGTFDAIQMFVFLPLALNPI